MHRADRHAVVNALREDNPLAGTSGREVWEVLVRCSTCCSARTVLLHEWGMDDVGDAYEAVYRDVIPHGKRECERMVTLAREEWPTLF